jgi:ribose 5-phosphate isomerase B
MAEKIPIGSDHAGFEIKNDLVQYLKELGYEPEDVGAAGKENVDYPDFAREVARKISRGERNRGVLVCGTGIGMSITANKFKGVRASLCMNEEMAELARQHNDANVLALGGRLIGKDLARAILKKWLETEFEGGRHARRVKKIASLEE